MNFSSYEKARISRNCRISAKYISTRFAFFLAASDISFFVSDMSLVQAPVRAKKFRWRDIDFYSWIFDVDKSLRISFERTVIKNFLFTAAAIDFLDYALLDMKLLIFVYNVHDFLISFLR